MLKAKAVGFSVRDQRTLHSPVTRARRGRIMANAVAWCFRLELGVAAPARGPTHAVPPRRQAQDRSCANMKWCRVTDKKPTGVGNTKIAGTLATRMESSGDMGQTLYMILEGRT
jgi:hypothetical protein